MTPRTDRQKGFLKGENTRAQRTAYMQLCRRLETELAEAKEDARLWENEALQSRATIALMLKTAEEYERQKASGDG